MAQCCTIFYMPLRNLKQKTALPQKADSTLRVIRPIKKTSVKSDDTSQIVIDQKHQKRYASLITLLHREFRHKKRTPMPIDLKPMLASIIEKPFNDKDWQFEIKWDGYRTLAYVADGAVQLRSRNNLSFNTKYSDVGDALKDWPLN